MVSAIPGDSAAIAAAWQSGTVKVRGGHLAYHRTGGNGAKIVLSHGLTDNGLCWSRFAAALADQFDLIMLDARGHGASSRMPPDDPPAAGQDLAEAIEGLGLVSPIVMGHSVGARATAEFAAANPACAAMVVLEDPPLSPPFGATEMQQRRTQFQEQVAKLHALTASELAELGHRQSPSWDNSEFPAWVQSKQQVDPRALPDFQMPWQAIIAAIKSPILLICGEPALGGMVRPEQVAEAKALNSFVSSAPIAGAGHNIRRENFADYVIAVRKFLGAGGRLQKQDR